MSEFHLILMLDSLIEIQVSFSARRLSAERRHPRGDQDGKTSVEIPPVTGPKPSRFGSHFTLTCCLIHIYLYECESVFYERKKLKDPCMFCRIEYVLSCRCNRPC